MPLGTLAAIQLGAGILQTGAGIAGMAFNKRPIYKMPGEINEMVSSARKNTMADMPGYEAIKGGIDVNQANAIELAKLSGDPLSVAPTVQASSNKAVTNLGVQNATYKTQQLSKYYTALQAKAQAKDLEFQINEFSPYADKQKMFADLFGGGLKNISGGATMLGLNKAGMLNEVATNNTKTVQDQNASFDYDPSFSEIMAAKYAEEYDILGQIRKYGL